VGISINESDVIRSGLKQLISFAACEMHLLFCACTNIFMARQLAACLGCKV
jgi:hypothetical protein